MFDGEVRLASKSAAKPRYSIRGICHEHISNQRLDNNMNKAQLLELVQKNLGGETSKRAAADALEAVLSAVAKGVKKDGNVQLIGFGTFKVAKRAARTGRNPKTGASMKIKASKTVRFVASSSLKGSL
jgi:nucleoid DNA-binding protein